VQTLQLSVRAIDLYSRNENKQNRGEWSWLLEADVRLGRSCSCWLDTRGRCSLHNGLLIEHRKPLRHMEQVEVICIFQTKSGPIWLVPRYKVGPQSVFWSYNKLYVFSKQSLGLYDSSQDIKLAHHLSSGLTISYTYFSNKVWAYMTRPRHQVGPPSFFCSSNISLLFRFQLFAF
jgi:hypothetical protein